MEKVVVGEKTGCWNWTAALHPGGYGAFGFGRKKDGKMAMVLAHRFAYEHFMGTIPDGLEIDHLCRNRACVNPEHLEAVTRQVNQLRGESVSGAASRRTHCPKGHSYDDANTHVTRDGSRRCIKCNREASREAQRRRSARRRAAQTGTEVPAWAAMRT